MQNVDVAIVGGGMVGLALACGLQGSGLRVAVLEQNAPQPVAQDAPPALRVSAINAASEKLLTHLGVWSEIVAQRASCYHGMEVWDKDSFGHIAFDDESMGYSHLGHIVENAVIHHALWRKAQQPTKRYITIEFNRMFCHYLFNGGIIISCSSCLRLFAV